MVFTFCLDTYCVTLKTSMTKLILHMICSRDSAYVLLHLPVLLECPSTVTGCDILKMELHYSRGKINRSFVPLPKDARQNPCQYMLHSGSVRHHSCWISIPLKNKSSGSVSTQQGCALIAAVQKWGWYQSGRSNKCFQKHGAFPLTFYLFCMV